MDLQQIIDLIRDGAIGLVIILLGMVRIPKIEVNFWGWLGKKVGKVINGEVVEKVENLSSDLEEMKKEAELERVRQARQRILRFSDEILYYKQHSKEHFDEILDDITLYEQYCRDHEDYENNKAVLAIATIRDIYQDCMKTHNFLTHVKK